MAKKQTILPPYSENPAVLLPPLTPRQELDFLKEFTAANDAKDVDRAAKCALEALSTAMEPKLVDSLVGTVNNLAHFENKYSPLVTKVLCKAADRGFLEYAYNAGNQLVSNAKTAQDFKEAEWYFKMAMAYSENPAMQAAAHVNYCPIVRDGLITGKPDWPAAVEIYEVAARMGLVKAMFNAGNVSSWLADKGDRAYGARAAYWFKYALDYRAAGKPRLDMESLDELEGVFEECILGLSACHIDAKFDGAQLEEGIKWAKELADKGNMQARHNLGVGYINRLAGLTAKPQSSPGANWRSVLAQMDWVFKGELEQRTIEFADKDQGLITSMEVDKLQVALRDGAVIPMFVTHDPFLPCFEGIEVLQILAKSLARRYPKGFFLQTRRALFIEQDGSPYTPIYIFHKGRFSIQVLWMGSSPELVLQHAEEGVGFLDERFRTWTCMIPIAVNVLDEGYVVADRARFDLPWVGAGGPWCMPFSDEDQLLDLGIALKR